jgi:hypothetical protein
MLYQTPPSYSYQKVFESLCYASSLQWNRAKFDPRAIPYIFIRYPFGMKAYKLCNMLTRTVFNSRYVIFYENIFSFHHSKFLTSLSKPDAGLSHGSSLFPASTHDFSFDSSVSNSNIASVPTTSSSPLISSSHSPHLPDIHNQESTHTPPVPTR